MNSDITILYYSANIENPKLEAKVLESLVANSGGLPIVSVTQVPISVGENICVGRHHPAYYNEFRQIQIGLQAITTPYVLTAEADFFYPPEYFACVVAPPKTVARYDNVWVLFYSHSRFYFKGSSDGAQLVNRLAWLERLQRCFGDKESWIEHADQERLGSQPRRTGSTGSWSGPPAVTLKTTMALRRRTNTVGTPAVSDLPGWGSATELMKQVGLKL